MIRNRDPSSSSSSNSKTNHAATATTHSRTQSKKGKKTAVSTTRDELFSFAKLLLVFLLCGWFVAEIQKKFLWNDLLDDDDLVETLLFEEEIREEEQRLLLTIPDTNNDNNFPTLHYALQHSDLVVLYYAAVWCPLSNAVTDQLKQHFGGDYPDVHDLSLLLPENHKEQNNDSNDKKKKRLSILYVSSDKNNQAYVSYTRETSGWMIPVPYNSQEQEGLKKHFKVWSKLEVEKFMPDERQHEIPSILVLSTKTQSIITTEGVEHVADYGENVVNFWEDLVKEEQVYQAKAKAKQQ